MRSSRKLRNTSCSRSETLESACSERACNGGNCLGCYTERHENTCFGDAGKKPARPTRADDTPPTLLPRVRSRKKCAPGEDLCAETRPLASRPSPKKIGEK